MSEQVNPIDALGEDVKFFLDKSGITVDTLKILQGDGRGEDYDKEIVVNQYLETRRKIFENNLSPDFYKGRMDEEFKTLKGTHANKLAKMLGLPLTSKEARELGFEAALEKAEQKYKSDLEAAGKGGDAEKTKQIKEWQEKYLAEKDAREAATSEYEARILEAEQSAEKGLERINVDNQFKTKMAVLPWGIDATLVPIVQEKMQREIEDAYDVSSKGISGKNGAHPTSFDGKTIYKSLDEAILDLFNKYNVAKQSNSGTPPTAEQGKQVSVDSMDEETKAWMARRAAKRA